jgi:hypothetical protein
MHRRSRLTALLVIAILSYPALLLAQYTLVLKNGRRITVQAYREEGQMIKVYGIGGEIGIPRDEVQSILRAGEGDARGLDLRGGEELQGGTTESGPEEQKPTGRAPGSQPRSEGSGTSPSRDPLSGSADQKAKEEETYRRKVEEVTEQLKAAEDNYLSTTRGTSSPDPMLLQTDEAIRARNDDLNSRLKDAQHNPGGPSDAGSVKLSVPSPFIGQPPTTTEIRPGEAYNSSGVPIYTPPIGQTGVNPPPPAYTDKEKELSDLRNRMNQLVKDREKLIEEMKQKNLETGNLFLE